MPFLAKFADPRPKATPGLEGLAADVLRNLTNILETRRGYGSVLDDLGLTDLGGCQASGIAVHTFLDQLAATVRRHEPRLRLDAVELLPARLDTRVGLLLRGVLSSGRPLVIVATARWDAGLVLREQGAA